MDSLHQSHKIQHVCGNRNNFVGTSDIYIWNYILMIYITYKDKTDDKPHPCTELRHFNSLFIFPIISMEIVEHYDSQSI